MLVEVFNALGQRGKRDHPAASAAPAEMGCGIHNR